jgi:hypothetical protein
MKALFYFTIGAIAAIITNAPTWSSYEALYIFILCIIGTYALDSIIS